MKRKKIIISIVAILLIGTLLLVMSLYVKLSGGVRGMVNNYKKPPEPYSKKISAMRGEASQAISDSFSEVESNYPLVEYASSFHDGCGKGQQNMKQADHFAYRCMYRTSKFYGFDSGFEEWASNFHLDLIKKRWSDSIAYRRDDKIFEEYNMMVDRYVSEYGGTNERTGRQYVISDLPTQRYTRDGYELNIKLGEFADIGTPEYLFPYEYAQKIKGYPSPSGQIHDVKNFQDIASIFSEITSKHKYFLMISIEGGYFKN